MPVDLTHISTSDIEVMARDTRIELLSKVWNSLFENDEFVSVNYDVMQLLDERLAEYETNPDACIPWEDVLKEIRARK
jgi:putative addiction module component (TIGR02574 family)